MTTVRTRKKLIEVALPLAAINTASLREGYIYRGNPSALHKWWAQRPLAAARAVIFTQLVDDPSAVSEEFPTETDQERERQRLFRIISDLVVWENTTNSEVLERARTEIQRSWERACRDNADHARAAQLFNPGKLPVFHDPFAGGGALPLEAQRLSLESFASDLNPVAVLINKAMIEMPPRFAGRPPVNPDIRKDRKLFTGPWSGVDGIADDVRHYGKWIRDEAEKRIGHLYPKIQVSPAVTAERPDLKAYEGQDLTVVAWLWARTVLSPNPAFANVEVPLTSTFMLSTKRGKETYVEPVIENGDYRFTVKVGIPPDAARARGGTKLSRANFSCLMSGTPVSSEYIKAEGMAGRMGARLMAIVAEGNRGRVYLAPTREHEEAARAAKPAWRPDGEIPKRMTGGNCTPYGLTTWGDLFTPRQLVALTTISDLVQQARERIRADAISAGYRGNDQRLRDGGDGPAAYADAISTYLAFAQDKTSEYGCTIVPWYNKEDRPKGLFARQAIPMVWDFAEVNPLSDIGGSFAASVNIVAGALSGCASDGPNGTATQGDALQAAISNGALVSTDPPYYDNVGYADLSDFFYVWLRRSMQSTFPELFATLAVPKAEELVANPSRHGSREQADAFFLDGMTRAMHRLASHSHPALPVTIYYAYRQSEGDHESGISNTGWDTFLEAVIDAGFAITGTWPMRTERGSRSTGIGTNALASSIILVCRPRSVEAPPATRREFVAVLKDELPRALADLQHGNIAPVDLAQAAIGPGMAVYTRFAQVLDAAGKPLRVSDALALINQMLDDALAEQEGDFDADTRWALTWFEQLGFAEGDYGVAEQLSKSKNTSVTGLVEAGIALSARGKVRLLAPTELPKNWDPATDRRLTHWDAVHHLIRVLEGEGEAAAARLVAKLGSMAETARELAYRLYTISERKKRAAEALSYNALVQSWPEMLRLAQSEPRTGTRTTPLFGEA